MGWARGHNVECRRNRGWWERVMFLGEGMDRSVIAAMNRRTEEQIRGRKGVEDRKVQ